MASTSDAVLGELRRGTGPPFDRPQLRDWELAIARGTDPDELLPAEAVTGGNNGSIRAQALSVGSPRPTTQP